MGGDTGRRSASGNGRSGRAAQAPRELSTRVETTVEYVVEELDADGEIVDVVGFNNQQEAYAHAESLEFRDIALVRIQGSEAEGELERQYAYIENGVIPEEFDGGARVPQRFR